MFSGDPTGPRRSAPGDAGISLLPNFGYRNTYKQGLNQQRSRTPEDAENQGKESEMLVLSCESKVRNAWELERNCFSGLKRHPGYGKTKRTAHVVRVVQRPKLHCCCFLCSRLAQPAMDSLCNLFFSELVSSDLKGRVDVICVTSSLQIVST